MECTNCKATILESTFRRSGGLCKPCWKEQRRKRIGETPFGKAYDTYFRQPGRLTETYFDCWINLELKVAGPLFAARDKGDVRFIFRKQAITGAGDFDGLIAWMRREVERFRNHVRETEAVTPDEVRSRDALLSRAADLETLINLWPDFDKEFGREAA